MSDQDYYANLCTLLTVLEAMPERVAPLGGIMRALVTKLREESLRRFGEVEAVAEADRFALLEVD